MSAERAHDPRLTLACDRFADSALRDLIVAPEYRTPDARRISAPLANIRQTASSSGAVMTQALYGEPFSILGEVDGWAFGRLETDGYVGYVDPVQIAHNHPPSTHRVTTRATYIYPAPDIKGEPMKRLSFGARLVGERHDERFLRLADGFVWSAHAESVQQNHAPTADALVRAARLFEGTPYLWGGRSADGLDCSALVQLACAAIGIALPRDSDMQMSHPGFASDLAPLEAAAQRSGDLIFWKGHVGLMSDETNLIHANGHHMLTVCEPLDEAVSRIASLYDQPLGYRRLSALIPA